MSQNIEYQFDHVVCGGGLVGCLWALYLKRHTNSVAIFQAYEDLRQQLVPEGRSINLVLSKKGLDALSEIGIKQQVLKNTIPIKGQYIHMSNGEVVRLSYGVSENDIVHCISRNKLGQILISIAEINNIPLFFGHQLIGGDIPRNSYTFRTALEDEEIQVKVKAKHMYGTDGAGSKVREILFRELEVEADIQWFNADYKEIFVPMKLGAQGQKQWMFDQNWVHIWPRGGHLIMGHPNYNGSFSLNLIMPSEGEHSFDEINSDEKVNAFFQQFYPDLKDKIPNLAIQFTENPVGYLGTVKCPKWHFQDKVALLGDSAHTITPFLWQAVNIGMDDCLNFNKILENGGFNQKTFDQYEKTQKPKANALALLAIQNQDVLANRADEREYIELKKREKQLETVYPQKFWSKYRMVFFGEQTYDQIYKLNKQYDKILQQFYEQRISTTAIQQMTTKLQQISL